MSTFTAASLQRRPRARAALSAGGARVARVDNHSVTRRAALRALPRMLERRFDPRAGAGLRLTYELRVLASPGGPEQRFALAVADGRLAVTPGPAPDAQAWIAISLADMIRLVSGTVELWPLMAAKGLDIGGEPFSALRFPPLLRL